MCAARSLNAAFVTAAFAIPASLKILAAAAGVSPSWESVESHTFVHPLALASRCSSFSGSVVLSRGGVRLFHPGGDHGGGVDRNTKAFGLDHRDAQDLRDLLRARLKVERLHVRPVCLSRYVAGLERPPLTGEGGRPVSVSIDAGVGVREARPLARLTGHGLT
jgi:hypothetical protein